MRDNVTCVVCGLPGTQARTCRALQPNMPDVYAHDECAIAAFEFAARATVVADTLELIQLTDALDDKLCRMRAARHKANK